MCGHDESGAAGLAFNRYRAFTRPFLLLLAGLVFTGNSFAKDKPYRAEGARVMAMVVQLASRAETLGSGADSVRALLQAEGIGEDLIKDGSVAIGVVYCCGGKISRDTALVFYVLPELELVEGDIVEVVLGRNADRKKNVPGKLNRAVVMRENIEDADGSCHWDPEDDRMWMRVLECTWMEPEGWIFQGGLNKTWYKPASVAD